VAPGEGRAKSITLVEIIKRITRGSPRLRARIAGVLYLVIFIAAPSGAESATLAKMAITLACDTGVALLFYDLFKPVSKNLSLLAAAFKASWSRWRAWGISPSSGRRSETIYSFPIFWFLRSSEKGR
jgi:hypothetical protein